MSIWAKRRCASSEGREEEEEEGSFLARSGRLSSWEAESLGGKSRAGGTASGRRRRRQGRGGGRPRDSSE